MRATKILLVEDDELACEIIADFLIECGFDVTSVFTATDGVAYVKHEWYDLLILDINLPDFNGYEVLKSIKNHTSIPVIVTSAYSDTKSKILAFKYGASDYMVKPLDLEELEARVWVQLSQNSEIKTQEERSIFELKDSKVFFQQSALDLTTIEYEIMSILIKNKNQTIKRDDLVDALSSLSSHRSLDNHIKNIRKKIGDNGNKATYLKTEYGVGYKLSTY
jgi:DNA-binding response OmpR family regulator